MYCGAVPDVHVSIFLTKKQIKNEETTPSIWFKIYQIIGRCTANGRIPLKYKKYVTCVNDNRHQINLQNIYTRKELVMMEKCFSRFNIRYYILDIQKLAFHLPHVRILNINHCGEMRHNAFKRRELSQYFLCLRDCAERVVARFANKIQS